MSRLSLPLLVIALAIAAMLVYAACDGDDDEGDDADAVELLAAGDYASAVSGTIEFSLAEESVSAVAFGPARNTAELSGTATLNMGSDGSFEIKEWGISGTFSEGGQTQAIEMRDSSVEPTTGQTTAEGTSVDAYFDVTISDTETRSGSNTDTIAMSGDPLLNTTESFELEMTNGPIEIVDANDVPVATVYALNFLLDLNLADLEPDDADGDGDAGGNGQDGDGEVPTVLVKEFAGCQHTEPGVRSVLQKLAVILLLGGLQSSQQAPNQPELLVLVTDEASLGSLRDHPVLGEGTPLEGATVNATASGPGVIAGEETQQEVTNAQGEARLEFGINRFGGYQLTVGSVAAPDGTLYQFDPDSNLSETFEVGETCESPPGW